MPILSNAMSWIRGKARLIIEYALIAGFVALAGYAVSSYVQRRQLVGTVSDLSGRLSSVSQTLDQQVQTNKDQDTAITEISRLRSLDGKAIAGLQNDLSEAQAKDQTIRAKLAQLERNNAAAKSLLDTTVPRAVGCVLDGTPCADSNQPDGH